MTTIEKLQKNEITEHFVYKKLAKVSKDQKNKKILNQISDDELKHYNYWKKVTNKEKKPNKLKIYYYFFLAKIFGLAFALRFMESGEDTAITEYKKLVKKYPKLKTTLIPDEQRHEKKLIGILHDERLEYASSIVLGLNDALVELTGTLAGLSFAIRDSNIISVTGAIMGLAAALSMGASEYLSSKEEKNEKSPLKSAFYTGVAYILTVIILVAPYLVFENIFTSLICMVASAIIIIALYTFYISIAKNKKFWKGFSSMALISLGVAVISFGFGILIKLVFGVEV
ncbi:MAG: VIT1/CCC1 transporter family protein [Nanoarchaeota archaeon]